MADDNEMACDTLPMSMTTCATDHAQHSAAVVIEGLRPRQIQACTLLAQGYQGKQVAAAIGIAPETLSRWKTEAEFQALMHQLLAESIDATRLGIVSLCAESIDHLRGLVRSFNDSTSLKAITLILTKAGPILGLASAELQRPAAREERHTQ